MDTTAKKYLKINKALYKKASNPLKSHGPDHHLRVYEKSMKLVDGKRVDKEVLTAACFLHDIAAYYPDEVEHDHHEEDPKRAEKILRDNNFPSEKIEAVVQAIGAHGSGKEYKEQRESMEAKILCDADKLDIFGPLGIARIIMVKTLRGATLEEIVDDFFTKGHLQRKWDAISLDEAKEMGRKDFEYSQHFFKELSERL